MSFEKLADDLKKEVSEKYRKDLLVIQQRLARFIDVNIIGEKFRSGFNGHKLKKSTIKKKGNDKLGVETGALRKAAVAFTSWQMFGATLSKKHQFMIKDQNKFTDYSSAFRTEIGGKIDIVKLEPEDISKINSELKIILNSLGYSAKGFLRILDF